MWVFVHPSFYTFCIHSLCIPFCSLKETVFFSALLSFVSIQLFLLVSPMNIFSIRTQQKEIMSMNLRLYSFWYCWLNEEFHFIPAEIIVLHFVLIIYVIKLGDFFRFLCQHLFWWFTRYRYVWQWISSLSVSSISSLILWIVAFVLLMWNEMIGNSCCLHSQLTVIVTESALHLCQQPFEHSLMWPPKPAHQMKQTTTTMNTKCTVATGTRSQCMQAVHV